MTAPDILEIGLISQAWPPSTRREARGWQSVVTMELREAFHRMGIEAEPVVWDARTGDRRWALPIMRHAVVISELPRQMWMCANSHAVPPDWWVRGGNNGQDAIQWGVALRKQTLGKVCLYIDAPMGRFHDAFDLVFTAEDGTQPAGNSIHVGAGSDYRFRPEGCDIEGKTPYAPVVVVQYPDPRIMDIAPEAWPIMAAELARREAAGELNVVGMGFSAAWVNMDVVAETDEEWIHEAVGPVLSEADEPDPCSAYVGQPVEHVPDPASTDGGQILKWEGVGRYVPYATLHWYMNGAAVYVDTRGGCLDLTRIDAGYAGLHQVAHTKNHRKAMHGKLFGVSVWDGVTPESFADRLDDALACGSRLQTRNIVAEQTRQHWSWDMTALRITAALGV